MAAALIEARLSARGIAASLAFQMLSLSDFPLHIYQHLKLWESDWEDGTKLSEASGEASLLSSCKGVEAKTYRLFQKR